MSEMPKKISLLYWHNDLTDKNQLIVADDKGGSFGTPYIRKDHPDYVIIKLEELEGMKISEDDAEYLQIPDKPHEAVNQLIDELLEKG